MNKSEIEPAVPAVVLQDILNLFSSETVIIKMDIDGFECKVNARLKQRNHFSDLALLCTVNVLLSVPKSNNFKPKN